MTTHNHGRVSPFGHPRINAHQATPRGLTQPITSFIGLAYPGIHHAPKNKKHNFSRTDNKKYQEQNHKKEKTNNNTIIVAIFIAFASTIQFSHNTPPHTQHPHRCNPKTHRPQPARYYFTRGDLQNNTRAALDTQQHAKKQNKPEHKHTHPCFTDPPTRAYNHVRYLSSPENKNLPPPGANQHPHSDKTKILYSP